MKRALIPLAGAALLLAGCVCDYTALGEPVAQGRAAARVQADRLALGDPLDQEMVEYLALNREMWETLWQLVQVPSEE